ncbi:MAG: MlaD family protein [Bacteroidota bacterium]|jgi:phospholipid/cholesterol/gamma-HCH transport system substrate-binding protein
MAIKYKRELRIGIVFILATVVLIWGLMYLKGLELFSSSRIFYAVYDNVDGLQVSNPVTLNGLQIGQVNVLSFDKSHNGKIICELYIKNDYPLTKNSIARIRSSSLLGSKEVAIILGKSTEKIKNGDTLKTEIEASLGSEVNKQLLPLKVKAENLISSIDSVVTIVQLVLNRNTRENLVQAIDHVKDALANISHATFSLDTLVSTQKKNIAGIIINVESISRNLKQNNEKITNIISNLSDLSDSLAKARIPATIMQVNTAVRSLNTTLEKINNGEGSLGLLVNDQKLYIDLENAARNLNLLIEDLKANPKKYLKISVF